MTVSARLAELGVTLPAVATPLAAYIPAVRTGNLVYTSGQLPLRSGELTHSGKVGSEVPPEEGKVAARTCVLNALAAIDALVGIDSVVRSAVGVSELPLDAPVEVELIVEVR